MARYFIYPDGRCAGECVAENPVNPDGLDIITHDKVVGDPFDYVLVNGSLVFYSVMTLDQAKAAKNAEINAARAEANSQTFPHDGREFACDALSRSDIDGINGYVALNGSYPAQFPGAWKAVDNSYYPLPDISAWKAFYASMVATGAANFAHAQNLKAQLTSATTVEEVEAIAW